MTTKTDMQRLREFLSIERDKAQEKLAEYANNLPSRNKQAYSRTEAIHLQKFSATLWKVQTYSEIIDIIKEMGY